MSQSASAVRIPESMGPAEVGPYMRELRDHFSLSAQEVSERLHIRLRYINAIEEGRFDQMPGKVYARGYIHTYAEFLGLDANQVVAQCFVADTAANGTAIATPVAFVPSVKLSGSSELGGGSSYWRGIGIVIVVALLSLVAFTQLTGTSDKPSTPETVTVAPVPEAMLASVRTVIMPTARNYDCLMDTQLLSCFFAQDMVQKIDALLTNETEPFAVDILPEDPAATSPEKPVESVGLMRPYLAPLDDRHD